MSRKPFIALLALLTVALVGCGGASGDGSDDTGGTTSTTAAGSTETTAGSSETTTTEAAMTTTTTSGGEPASEEGTAAVEIGDFRYEFNATPGSIRRCDPDFFGAFWVIGITGEGMSGDTVEMLLPPEGDPNHSDAPRVTVTDEENGIDWIADPDSLVTNADQTKVDSWTVDGNGVSGTATFLKAGDTNDGELVTGTFQADCPPKE
jgi:hypothetical protein